MHDVDVVNYFQLLKDDISFVDNHFANNSETEKIINFSHFTEPVISVAMNKFHPDRFHLKRTDLKGTIKYFVLYTDITIV